MATKKNLPAKYAKMTVCTFWVLNQLKTSGILTDEQMRCAITDEFHLNDCNDDQMLHYNDLVENFDEHESNLKSYIKTLQLDGMDDADAEKERKKETKQKELKKKVDDMDIIAQIIREHEQIADTAVETDDTAEPKPTPKPVIVIKPKLKIIAKKIIINPN